MVQIAGGAEAGLLGGGWIVVLRTLSALEALQVGGACVLGLPCRLQQTPMLQASMSNPMQGLLLQEAEVWRTEVDFGCCCAARQYRESARSTFCVWLDSIHFQASRVQLTNPAQAALGSGCSRGSPHAHYSAAADTK